MNPLDLPGYVPRTLDIVVLYHGGCPDGFGAAFAAWMFYRNTEHRVQYIPVRHYEPIPETAYMADIVYILDFCYSRPKLDHLASIERSVVVLDHHASNERTLFGFEEHTFDMEHSGSVIAWRYFHRDALLPRLFRHIQDQDLWQWKLTDSKYIMAYVNYMPHDFEQWLDIMESIEANSNDIRELGTAILMAENSMVETMAKNHAIGNLPGTDISLPIVNAAILGNRVAHRLIDTTDSPIAATYFVRADG